MLVAVWVALGAAAVGEALDDSEPRSRRPPPNELSVASGYSDALDRQWLTGMSGGFVEVAYTRTAGWGTRFSWRPLRAQLFLHQPLPTKAFFSPASQPLQFLTFGSDVVFVPFRSLHRSHTLDVETYLAGGLTVMVMRTHANGLTAAEVIMRAAPRWSEGPMEVHAAAHFETGLDLRLPYLPDVHVRPFVSCDVSEMLTIGWFGWRAGLSVAWRFGTPAPIAEQEAPDPINASRPPVPL